MGALALDAGAFEEIEADPKADRQSIVIMLAVVAAGGVAAFGLGLAGPAGFAAGALTTLGAWLVWVAMITALGTTTLAEPSTQSNTRELLRVLGYASAPGLFVAFASIPPAAPVVFAVVAAWMVSATVLGVRQALDFRSTWRAVAVCVVAFILSAGVVGLFVVALSRPVN